MHIRNLEVFEKCLRYSMNHGNFMYVHFKVTYSALISYAFLFLIKCHYTYSFYFFTYTVINFSYYEPEIT